MMKTKNIVSLFLIILLCLSAIAQISGNTGIGTFTDKRDGKMYRSVKIGKLTWMAENLNFQADSSWCYKNADSNCVKYGRLYTWDAAMTACPAGWRLPDTSDWNDLVSAASGDNAGRNLKSTTGWYNKNSNGVDLFGFSALPGGARCFDGRFFNDGYYGLWWGATESWWGSAELWWSGAECESCYAYRWYMFDYYEFVNNGDVHKSWGFSVRCVRDL